MMTESNNNAAVHGLLCSASVGSSLGSRLLHLVLPALLLAEVWQGLVAVALTKTGNERQ